MSFKRLIGIITAYVITCFAWVFLAGVTGARTDNQRQDLRGEVSTLWGESQVQSAPTLSFRAVVPAQKRHEKSRGIEVSEGELLGLEFPEDPEEKAAEQAREKMPSWQRNKLPPLTRSYWAIRRDAERVPLGSSDLRVSLGDDPRRKGLVWYSLYDVDFAGAYTYVHEQAEAGYLDVSLGLPSDSAMFDALVFDVNGEDMRAGLSPETGMMAAEIPVRPGDTVTFKVAYTSRGSDMWQYNPGGGVQQLENFRLAMVTDFQEIDFPSQTVSPSSKERQEWGWSLVWDFKSTVTGHRMGMVLPDHIQPGELATALIYSGPISLMFFFLLLFMLATLRKLDIHPVNYLFLGAAFFSFHLLFSYSADQLSVPWAFAASSVTSLLLVVTYLRLVVSTKFAFREAALGQLVYLIGFSLAHFWEGYTGLTITVLAIITLFLLMQVTGRLNWSEVLATKSKTPLRPPPVPEPEPAQ